MTIDQFGYHLSVGWYRVLVVSVALLCLVVILALLRAHTAGR